MIIPRKPNKKTQKNSHCHVSQPHFWESVRMTLTFPKMGTWESSMTPKLQSSIVGVKAPCLDVFFISLESYWSVNVENRLVAPFGHLQHKLWAKEWPIVNLAIWFPITKSQESTWSRCVQGECDTRLESSQGELQLCFRPHPNRRSEQRVMMSQSLGSPRTKSHSGVSATE